VPAAVRKGRLWLYPVAALPLIAARLDAEPGADRRPRLTPERAAELLRGLAAEPINSAVVRATAAGIAARFNPGPPAG
jgi:hypothetical protein